MLPSTNMFLLGYHKFKKAEHVIFYYTQSLARKHTKCLQNLNENSHDILGEYMLEKIKCSLPKLIF